MASFRRGSVIILKYLPFNKHQHMCDVTIYYGTSRLSFTAEAGRTIGLMEDKKHANTTCSSDIRLINLFRNPKAQLPTRITSRSGDDNAQPWWRDSPAALNAVVGIPPSNAQTCREDCGYECLSSCCMVSPCRQQKVLDLQTLLPSQKRNKRWAHESMSGEHPLTNMTYLHKISELCAHTTCFTYKQFPESLWLSVIPKGFEGAKSLQNSGKNNSQGICLVMLLSKCMTAQGLNWEGAVEILCQVGCHPAGPCARLQGWAWQGRATQLFFSFLRSAELRNPKTPKPNNRDSLEHSYYSRAIIPKV